MAYAAMKLGIPATIFVPTVASKAKEIPAWLGSLTAAEQALWDAFPLGGVVDLRAGDPANARRPG